MLLSSIYFNASLKFFDFPVLVIPTQQTSSFFKLRDLIVKSNHAVNKLSYPLSFAKEVVWIDDQETFQFFHF